MVDSTSFTGRTRLFGDGAFGEGEFSNDTEVNYETIKDAFHEHDINPSDEQVESLAAALTEVLNQFDHDIDRAYREFYLSTANDAGLSRKARVVDTARRDGERLPAFRTRVIANYAARTSNTTYDEFAAIVKNVLNASSGEVTLVTPPDSPTNTATVKIEKERLDASPFTPTTLANLLEDSVPAGHATEVQSRGTFEFAGDSYTPPSGTGFGSGTLGGVSE